MCIPFHSDMGGVWTNRYQFKEDRDYLDPSPVNELLINPNLTQNPGWPNK